MDPDLPSQICAWITIKMFPLSLSLCMIVSSCLILLIHVFSLSPTQLIKCIHTQILEHYVFFVFHVLYHIACWCYISGEPVFFYLYSCHTYITQDFCEWLKIPSWHSRFLKIKFLMYSIHYTFSGSDTHVCSYILSPYFDLYSSTDGLCVFN